MTKQYSKQKNLYVRSEHRPILDRVLAYLEQEHGPRSGEFSNFMWAAAEEKLANLGTALTGKERRMVEEVRRIIKAEIQNTLKDVGTVIPSQYPDISGVDVDPELTNLFGSGKVDFKND